MTAISPDNPKTSWFSYHTTLLANKVTHDEGILVCGQQLRAVTAKTDVRGTQEASPPTHRGCNIWIHYSKNGGTGQPRQAIHRRLGFSNSPRVGASEYSVRKVGRLQYAKSVVEYSHR